MSTFKKVFKNVKTVFKVRFAANNNNSHMYCILNLNLDYLSKEYKSLKNVNFNEEAITLHIAIEIVCNALGYEFVKREFNWEQVKNTYFENFKEPYFFDFAERIWKVRNCKGFVEYLEKSKNRDKTSIYSELYAASLFLEDSESVEFIIPSGKLSNDFDFLAKKFKTIGEDLNIEVKSRMKTFNSEKQVKNYLGNIKRQLPRNQKNCIFFRINPSTSVLSQNHLDKAIQDFLKSTSRVYLVVYFFTELQPLPELKAKAYKTLHRPITKEGISEPVFSFRGPYVGGLFIQDIIRYLKTLG